MKEAPSIENVAYMLKSRTDALNGTAGKFGVALRDYANLIVQIDDNPEMLVGESAENEDLLVMLNATRASFTSILESVDFSLELLRKRIAS